MYSFDRNNKTSGIYWLKQPIEDLSIKVKLQPRSGILNLPKYEDFVSTSNEVDISKVDTNRVNEYVFKWQEKVFSTREINYYNDLHNSTSEDDLENCEVLNSRECEPKKVFTYINEDYHSILSIIGDTQKKCFFGLQTCIDYLKVEDRIGLNFGISNSMHHLFSSEVNITEKHKWVSMHVVFDDSVYSDDSQLVLKQEHVLLSLYYNSKENYLILSPDTNDLELNPYNVVLENGLSTFLYAIQTSLESMDNGEELVPLLNKLYTKWEKKHDQLTHFEPAPAPRANKIVYVTFEILTAADFDTDDVYIEYEIKIPEDIKCEGVLHGCTHVSKGLTVDDTTNWTYGHIIEMVLTVAERVETPSLQMFFEAISVDWWGRHRTEGYCYLPLPLTPGYFTERLPCSRPEERNKVEANSRRFFVGGCHLIKDLDVLSKPQLQNANFSYTATGCIQVRWNSIAQSHGLGSAPASTPSGSSASALLQGAEAVLRQYSQARARLAAATKDLVDQD